MIRFYAPDIATDPVLPENDSHHCVKVLRMQSGDSMEIIDGKGGLYHCRMLEPHSKHATVEVIRCERLPLPWSYNLTVAVAPTKNMDRMEWLTEKLTEIGINTIVPVLCARSERKEIKTERLEKIAVSAMKQSLKAVLPDVMPMTQLKTFLETCKASQRFIAYCDSETDRKDMIGIAGNKTDTAILIGPEGDFTADEVALARQHGFEPVTLGDNRLRTETAALYAASAIHIINQFT